MSVLRSPRAALLAIGLLALLVYLNSLANGFAMDDVPVIATNDRVQELGRLWELLTASYWPTGPEHYGLYRPFTLLTYALDWQIWDGRPFGFHLVNTVVHAAVTVLVFLLLLRLTATRLAAAVGAAAFAVHPVHVEAVANVVGRAELLAAAFFLLGVLAYLRGGGGWRTAGLTASAYVLGLASKEITVTLPAILLLLETRGESRLGGVTRALNRALKEKWRVFLALTAGFVGYMALRFAATGAVLGNREFLWVYDPSWKEPLFTAIRLWPEYVRLMFFPADLIAEYGPAVIIPETSITVPVLIGLLTGLGAAGVAVLAWTRAPLISLGVLWFGLTVLPVSGILFPVGFMLAERTLYLPSVGVALVLAGVVHLIRLERPRLLRPAVAVLALLFALGAVRTWTRTPAWKSSDTLLATLVENHPESFRAQWLIALDMADQQRHAEMLRRYRTATAMAPRHIRLREEYGTALLRHRAYAAAAAQFDTAHAIDPDNQLAPIFRLRALVASQQLTRAVEEGELFVTAYPRNAGVAHELSRAYARQGRFLEAERYRRETMHRQGRPLQQWQWVNLAALRLMRGDAAAAASALDSARVTPADTLALATVPSLEALQAALEQGDSTVIPHW